MDWFYSIVRSAGASYPVAASLVQFHAEIEMQKLKQVIQELKDPISGLHPDIPEMSKEIYDALLLNDDFINGNFVFEDSFYKKYSRALSILESENIVENGHAIGARFCAGVEFKDPTYILYLCNRFACPDKMKQLYDAIENCSEGGSIDGIKLAADLQLPRAVVYAMLKLYESRHLGTLSKELGRISYRGIA